MRNLIVIALLGGLSLSAHAATYRISSSPASQVERVEQLAPTRPGDTPLNPRTPTVELMPTQGNKLQPLNNIYLRLGDYPGEQNPYVLPQGTTWPYPMSAPTYDGHYHLPGGQW